MKHEEYLRKRNELMEEAQGLIAQGEFDLADAKMKEVENLDERWDKQAQAEANMNALNGKQRKVNVQSLTGVPVQGTVVEATGQKNVKAEDMYTTEEYTNAFAKKMMGLQLTEDEAKTYALVNSTIETGTATISVVIPETVSSRIWREIEDQHPFIEDITKTYVKGKLTLIKKKRSSSAKWYEEGTKTEDGTEELATVELSGCELARAITVSWKLKEMSIPDFINYIVENMADEMGAGLSYGAIQGKGVRPGSPTEPEGIVTKMPESQIVNIEGEVPTYAELADARSKIKSGYRARVYANSDMIWNKLANVLDANGRPIFILDATAGGVYRIFGCEVKEEAGMPDNAVLFADAAKAYTMNINKQITMTPEEHVKDRVTDYCGYAIADGAIVSEKACSLLKK